MRPDDHFKIASLTKTYTATVVLQLAAERQLRLTDSVEQRLPGVVPNGHNITIRQLLNHTSGLADSEADPRYLEPYLSGDLGYYWSPRELVEMAVSNEPLFAQGETEHASYSNTNYVVAGLIVEQVTGSSIGAELKRRIFEPLRLRETTYPTRPGCRARSRTRVGRHRLHRGRRRRLLPWPAVWTPAQGRLAHGDEDDDQRGRQGGHTRAALFGLGLELFPTSCGDALGHNGVVTGYQTFIFSAENGQRQTLPMMNHDSATAPRAAGKAFIEIIDRAFCSRA